MADNLNLRHLFGRQWGAASSFDLKLIECDGEASKQLILLVQFF